MVVVVALRVLASRRFWRCCRCCSPAPPHPSIDERALFCSMPVALPLLLLERLVANKLWPGDIFETNDCRPHIHTYR